MSQDAAPEADDSDTEPDFVEYKEVLGKGASKKVYKAFDEWEGIEVKVADLLRNSVDYVMGLHCVLVVL
ncbi:hypothetical protein ACS0TY_020638 [Phlomoides rotata]